MTQQTLFAMGTERKKASALLLEFGADHCCYALLDGPSKSFELVRYFSFEETEAELNVAAVMDEIGGDSFHQVIVCSAFSEALMVPQILSADERPLLDALFEAPGQQYYTSRIAEWQMTAAWCLPASIAEAVMRRFPFAVFLHAYVPALKIYNGYVAPDQLDIHFTPKHFRVLVKKGNALQLAQTYSYKTPLDVAYYLLKICYEFQLDQKEVFLVVSGLIDADSAMHAELHGYFLNLHFAHPPSYTLPETGHPQYYFSSLCNLAACVS